MRFLVPVLGVLLFGCSSRETLDPRFESPSATLVTMLGAYGLEDVPEAEVRARLERRARFTLRDPETFRACFGDYAGPHDEGAAGFVLGRVAAAKDHLRVETEGDRATARLPGGTVVLRRGPSGWTIRLAESVPRAVRLQLHAVYRRSREQLERHGVVR